MIPNRALLRHFLETLFDSEALAASGDWKKTVFGVLAAVMSAGILALDVYWERYAVLNSLVHSTDTLYRSELRSDLLLFIGIAFAVTAALTLTQWQSLFPNRRDCLAFAGLPISARDIFFAKSCALTILFAAYALAMSLPWSILFSTAISGARQENSSILMVIAATFLTLGGACCFAFSILLALQGLLLNFLPARLFDGACLWLQGILFVATLGTLPLAARQPNTEWWPGMWFLHLWESIVLGHLEQARTALLSIAIPATIAIAAYLAGYHRRQRLLLEARMRRALNSKRDKLSSFGSRLLETWIRRPEEQAAFTFIWKTLVRSRSHRLLLLAWAGLATGWIVKGILDMPTPSLKNEGVYGMIVTVSPLAFTILVVLALHHLFSLPVTHKARWIFELEEYGGAACWLSAVDRFVICCGIGPVCLAGLPASIAVLGFQRALTSMTLVFLIGLLWFETLFRNWRKLPFTCSHRPSQRPFAITLLRYAIGSMLLAGIASLLLYCTLEPAALACLFTLLLWSVWRMRRSRRAECSNCAIRYHEFEEAEVNPLELGHFGFATSPVVSNAQLPKAEFDFHLTASRSIIPESITSEIAESIQSRTLLSSLRDDIWHGLRLIRRDPLVSLAVIVTLTAAIGLNASVFTVVNGYMLRPHITADPASFVQITPATGRLDGPRGASYAEYLAFQNGTRSVRALAAFARFGLIFGDDEDTGLEITGLQVSCNFFAVEGGVRPRLGRLFVADDCRTPGQAPVAILSENTWRNRFAADPGIIGRKVQINGRFMPVVGVVPSGTSGWLTGLPISVWVPYTAEPWLNPTFNLFKEDRRFWLGLAGRIAPGYNRSAIRAEFARFIRAQDKLNPGRFSRIETTDGSWFEWLELFANARMILLLAFFFGAFKLVLLIACANVATMLLSRAATRNREIAVRLSFGAKPGRIVRMLITESLILAAVAGLLSWVVVNKLPEPLAGYIVLRSDFPLKPDWRVVAWIATLVFATGLLAGIAPAMESLKVDLINSLKGFGGLFSGAGGPKRALAYLVSAQVALSMVLLVGAGLLSRAENRNLHANPGYDSRHIAIALFWRPAALDLVRDRVLSVPGVRSAAFSGGLPLFDPDTVELHPPDRPDALQPVDIFTGSPRFFETMGIQLTEGREFSPTDESGAAVVSQTLSRLFWHNRSPVGAQIRLPDGKSLTVVGVAKDIEPLRFGGSDNPPLYQSLASNAADKVMAIRFDPWLRRPTPSIRAAVREAAPDLSLRIRIMQNWIDEISVEIWNFASLILILGILATILSAAGIYGAVSFAVNQSRREFGIRAALGARRFDIIRSVYSSGGRAVVYGLLVGLWFSVATAAAFRKTLANNPLRVDSSDPLLYLAALVLLGASAALAMLLPARRGANSDPVEALRYD